MHETKRLTKQNPKQRRQIVTENASERELGKLGFYGILLTGLRFIGQLVCSQSRTRLDLKFSIHDLMG